jgi:hypothetical protein
MRQPPASHAPARLPRLRHWRDLQSLAYLVALPLIAWWQWQHGWNLWLYGIELFLTLGVGVIHHNHTHLRMWRGRRANRFTDYWLTLLQGHPTFVFWPAHVANHHRFRHGPRDVARTYRFGGDHNHLPGYLLHPLQAGWVSCGGIGPAPSATAWASTCCGWAVGHCCCRWTGKRPCCW